MPGVVWFGLITGAVVTVGLIFTLQIRRTFRELLLAGLFSVLIAFLLFLIWDFDAPYGRGISATAEPFLDLFPHIRLSLTSAARAGARRVRRPDRHGSVRRPGDGRAPFARLRSRVCACAPSVSGIEAHVLPFVETGSAAAPRGPGGLTMRAIRAASAALLGVAALALTAPGRGRRATAAERNITRSASPSPPRRSPPAAGSR